jgi:hypothetical protein
MMQIPEVTGLDVAFGNIKHMPKFDTLPEEFRRDRHPTCDAISDWFFSGAKPFPNGITIGKRTFTAKAGVDSNKAIAAIRSVLCSFEPKHEHKVGGCAFMLNEWFDMSEAKGKT